MFRTSPFPLILLYLLTSIVSLEAMSTEYLVKDTIPSSKKKPISEGYWGGISLNVVSMAQFQGDLESYNTSFGAPDHLGMELDDLTESWRVELNPFEYRQRFIGEYIAFTTGIGFDWWHIGIADEQSLYFAETEERVMAEQLSNDSIQVSRNHLDAVYLRLPILISLRTSRNGDQGLHIEAGLVGGYRIWSQYKNIYQTGANEIEITNKSFPINPYQLHARLALGFGNVSLLGEVSLLPFFEENRSPALHSMSLGLQFAFNGK